MVLAVWACEDTAAPGGTGSLSVLVLDAASSGRALDSGLIRVSGPTIRTVRATPGTNVRLDGLTPGTYTLTLEGFVGPNMVNHGRVSGIAVTAGQTSAATLASFPLVRLVFTAAGQPVGAGIGRNITPVVQVALIDGNGDVITTATNNVTVAIGTNPTGGTLGGTTTAAAVNGVASFSNLTINEAATGYRLSATSPGLVAVASNLFAITNRALVNHSTGAPGSVSIIDMATNTKGPTITVGNNPYEDVAFTADGAFAYVPNNSGGNVSVINMATGTVATTVTVGTGPRGLAFGNTPGGPRVYVTNFSSNNVSIINTTTNVVAGAVNVGTGPIRLAITPNGNFVYVTNFSVGDVSVIATATNTVITTIPITPGAIGPQGIAINQAGTRAYVSHSQGDAVYVINTATNTVIDTVVVGDFPVGIGVTPNGQFVYVANQGAGTVSVINTASNTVTATITLGALARNLAVTPGGRFVYVPDYSSSVLVISTATNAVVDTVPLAPSISSSSIGIAPLP